MVGCDADIWGSRDNDEAVRQRRVLVESNVDMGAERGRSRREHPTIAHGVRQDTSTCPRSYPAGAVRSPKEETRRLVGDALALPGTAGPDPVGPPRDTRAIGPHDTWVRLSLPHGLAATAR
jgi:hypothetical protein